MKMNRIVGWVFGFFALISSIAQEKPDLNGRVSTVDGSPVPDASVFIYTAGPRVGPGYI